MKKISNLDFKLNIKNYRIYLDEIIKNSADLYFSSNDNRFNLFHLYVSGLNYLRKEAEDGNFFEPSCFNHHKKSIFLKSGSLNFKNPIVKLNSVYFLSLYVGKIKRNNVFYDLFVSFRNFDKNTIHEVKGFTVVDSSNNWFSKENVKCLRRIDENFDIEWKSEIKKNLIGE